MMPPEVMESARLRLRRPTLGDAPTLFERYAKDPEVTRYLAWRPHEDVTRTEAFLQRCIAAWEKGEVFPWVLILRSEDAPIGMIELRMQGHRAEIGYVLARSPWGRGYMTEAAHAVVEWALSQPGVFRLWAVCDVENVASARLLEKLGMRREGILSRWIIHPNVSEQPRDCYCYAMTK